jgi:hypothetical protein
MARHNLYNINDFIGRRFGRLVVISEAPPIKEGNDGRLRPAVLCQCDCGAQKVVRIMSLKKGGCTSCGCFFREQASKRLFKHGLTHTRLFSIWESVLDRCYDHNSINYVNYGGRGIYICDEWKNDFLNFYNWAIANGYEDGLTIDRIDNDGNYVPSHCRWATYTQQARNRRNNHFLTFNGETKPIVEWSEKVGIRPDTIWHRLKSGKSVEEALTQPLQVNKSHIKVKNSC